MASSSSAPESSPSDEASDHGPPKDRPRADFVAEPLRNYTGGRLGLFLSDDANGADFTAALVHRWGRDRHFFEWDLGIVWPTESRADQLRLVHADLGVARFLTEGDAAIYVGGGAGPRIGGVDTWAFGAGAYGMAGVLVRTDKRIAVYLQARAEVDVFAGGAVGATGGAELGFGY